MQENIFGLPKRSPRAVPCDIMYKILARMLTSAREASFFTGIDPITVKRTTIRPTFKRVNLHPPRIKRPRDSQINYVMQQSYVAYPAVLNIYFWCLLVNPL
jgi:hypothetical protein